MVENSELTTTQEEVVMLETNMIEDVKEVQVLVMVVQVLVMVVQVLVMVVQVLAQVQDMTVQVLNQ